VSLKMFRQHAPDMVHYFLFHLMPCSEKRTKIHIFPHLRGRKIIKNLNEGISGQYFRILRPNRQIA
jgi:hypothetical protein